MTRDEPGGTLVKIVGTLAAMIGALYAVILIGGSRPPSPQAAAAMRARQDSELSEARTGAVEWATDECRERVRRAVPTARTEQEAFDASWRACPDHPDGRD